MILSQSSKPGQYRAGPAHAQRFQKYQKLPDGKPLPQGWRGSLAFANFFYSFKALECGHIPPAVRGIIEVYTTERSRQMALAEVRNQNRGLLQGMAACEVQQDVLWPEADQTLASLILVLLTTRRVSWQANSPRPYRATSAPSLCHLNGEGFFLA